MGKGLRLAAAAAACTVMLLPPPLYAHTAVEPVKVADDLEGIGRDFTFLDGVGKLRRVSDFRGSVVAVFFGFTHCPDICPGFLAKASAVRQQLGANKDRFKVIFVTVDPERDTREIMTRYLDLFGDGFISARIPGGELAAVVRDFAITNQRIRGAGGRISITHSSGAFLFDPQSRPAYYISSARDASYMAETVVQLLADKS